MSTARPGRPMSGFRPFAAFASRCRILACLLATVVAVMLQSAAPARAACDFEDVVNAMKAAGETAQVCKPVCEGDKYRCYASAALAIVLTEISRRKGQDHVDSFCSRVQGTLDDILGKLKLVGDLTDGQIDELSEAMKGLGDVLAVVNCACKTEQLQLQNEASFGACANEALKAIGCGELDWTTATVGGCDPVGGIVRDVVNDAIDALVELGCGWAWDCADESAGPVASNCVAGTQADQQGKCHYCSEFGPHYITRSDGLCGCEPPYDALRWGKRVIACECRAPNRLVDGQCVCPLGAQFVYGVCQCPLGTKADKEQKSCVDSCNTAAGEILDPATGRCATCPANSRTVYVSGSVGLCEACGYGRKVSADHKSCVPACAPGQVMGGLMLGKDQADDPAAMVCQTCPADTFASYEEPGGSRGVCLPCAAGTFAAAGATRCLPLNCGPGSYQDPDDPHACKSCPPTQIYVPTEKTLTKGPGGETIATVIAGHCGCGENQVMQGGTCVCAKGATRIALPQASAGLFACACPAGARFDRAAGACLCPEGAKLDQAKNACICPAGRRLEGGACVTRVPIVVAPKDCSTLGPRFVNDPKNPAACIRCPAGRIADADRTACVTPAGPARPAVVPPPAIRKPRPALRCPPGTVPNPAGTSCIRPIAAPPALSRQPARRSLPGTGIPARPQ